MIAWRSIRWRRSHNLRKQISACDFDAVGLEICRLRDIDVRARGSQVFCLDVQLRQASITRKKDLGLLSTSALARRPHLLDRLREVGWEIVIIPEIDPVQDNLCALHSTTALPILGRVRRFLILIIDVRLDARSLQNATCV